MHRVRVARLITRIQGFNCLLLARIWQCRFGDNGMNVTNQRTVLGCGDDADWVTGEESAARQRRHIAQDASRGVNGDPGTPEDDQGLRERRDVYRPILSSWLCGHPR